MPKILFEKKMNKKGINLLADHFKLTREPYAHVERVSKKKSVKEMVLHLKRNYTALQEKSLKFNPQKNSFMLQVYRRWHHKKYR